MNEKRRPENDPRLPRNLADTLALYAIVVVVALAALMPGRPDGVEADPVKIAGQPPAAERSADADEASDR
jgi:hypothetical protein